MVGLDVLFMDVDVVTGDRSFVNADDGSVGVVGCFNDERRRVFENMMDDDDDDDN